MLRRCMDIVVFWTYVYFYIPRTLMYVYHYIPRTLIYDICCVLNIEIYVVPTQPLEISGPKQASHILRGNPRGVWPAPRGLGPYSKWARGMTKLLEARYKEEKTKRDQRKKNMGKPQGDQSKG